MSKKVKNGLVHEDGETIYYENGVPTRAGIVKIDGDLYYAGYNGKIAVGQKFVHGSMTNDLIEHGTYTFDESGKMIEESFIPPAKSQNAKRKRFGKRFDSYNSNVLSVIAIVLLVIIAAVCFVLNKSDNTGGYSSGRSESGKRSSLIELPSYEDEVYLSSRLVENYYKGEINLDTLAEKNNGDNYLPFVFTYSLSEGAKAELELDGQKYELSPQKTELIIDNLMTGKTYPFSVTVTDTSDPNGKTESYDGSFTVAPTNRFITLPGVQNTRDIGGYKTASGKKVRQGLVIRGTEIDALVENDYFLTDPLAAEPFGFRYDFDLRESSLFSGNYHSRLGQKVRHRFYNSPMYGGIFKVGSRDALKQIFTDLADRNNYPMYLHCTYGVDRTGTIVFLLQGLLGVSEEDMKLEYSLSAHKDPDALNGVYNGLDSYTGSTINEKIETFLIESVGVTQEQIESIREIYLEE